MEPVFSSRTKLLVWVVTCWVTGFACTPDTPHSNNHVDVENVASMTRPDVSGPQISPSVDIAPPIQWQAPETYDLNVRRSEKASGRATKSLKNLCNDPLPSVGNVASGFEAHWGRPGQEMSMPGAMHRQKWDLHQRPLDWVQFKEVWGAQASSFVQRDHCKFKIWNFKLSTDGTVAWAKVRFRLNGLRIGNRSASIRGDLHAVFTGREMKLRGVRLVAGETVTRQNMAFVEVATNIGLRVNRSDAAAQILRSQVDAGLIETTGGIGAIHWNQDGFDDLIAWDARRTLQVYINDGRGGYDAIIDPIPPEAVGLHNLYIDLDGNGRAELVSSQIHGCQNGRAWFGLFERVGNTRLEFSGKRLQFATRCDGYRRVRYQHIAVEDVDADGDLDLFFSGFEGENSGRKKGNSFQAANGTPNLLFINHGQGRYVEVAKEQGIAGQDFTYLAKFIDVDGDGDRDLFTINDYGVNRVYMNDGRGKFSESKVGGLSDNGQSMGLSMADLNDDGELEIYVSNMYSYAGNRIVPLVEKAFQPETYRTLFKLAQGNTLYKRVGKVFTDSAGKLGLKNAGWAWGQAVLDLENDGDWDVYVANGNATHSNARAPDY